MKTIWIIVGFILSTHICSSQQLLGSSFETIKEESKKYNEEIAGLYYKELPVSLIVSRNRSTANYAKYFLFYDNKCVSETYFYPKSLFTDKLNYLISVYGNPIEQNSVYRWTSNNLRVSLTIAYSGISKNEVCQINYALVEELSKIVDSTQKSQSPFVEMVTIKTNLN